MSDIKKIIVKYVQKDLDQRRIIDVTTVARQIQHDFPDRHLGNLSKLVFEAVVKKHGNAYFNSKD